METTTAKAASGSIFLIERKGEDDKLTEKNQYGAARGVRSSTDLSIAPLALDRTPREALKISSSSARSSSSPSFSVIYNLLGLADLADFRASNYVKVGARESCPGHL